MKTFLPLLLTWLSLSLTACDTEPEPAVVVTSTFLERAVLDVRGDATRPPVQSLTPPGSCPGHFDLSPRMAPILRHSGLILYHAFQAGLARQIEKQEGAARLVPVQTTDGLLLPTTYGQLLAATAEALAARYPTKAGTFQKNAAVANQAAHESAEAARKHMRPHAGVSVIASAHQRDFCEWLGLEVVGEIRRPESMTPRDLQDLLDLPFAAVVANLQEGTQAAEALAKRSGRPLVVFSNFPGHIQETPQTYSELVQENVRVLQNALKGTPHANGTP